MLLLMFCIGGAACGPKGPSLVFEMPDEHPFLVADRRELQRLQSVLSNESAPGRRLLLDCIRRADRGLASTPVFPPRGGRHNQWYQCEKCQAPLRQREGRHLCGVCGREYTGPRYDDVLFRRQHEANLRLLLDSAWAYALTDNPVYARQARAILLGYAERYGSYPRRGTASRNLPYNLVTGGRLFDQTLCEAHAMAQRLAPAFDLIHDAAIMTEADRETLRRDLFRPLLENIERNWWNRGVCNWQSWHNAALFWGGAMLRDQAMMRRSFNDRRRGFFFQLEHAVNHDGMWHEGSWGYHYYALQALTRQAEGARRLGMDVWGHPRLRAMFLMPLDCVMPDGFLPRFGDDTGARPLRNPALIEAAWRNIRDERLQALLPEQPVWETLQYGRTTGPPPVASGPSPIPLRIFPDSGHVVFRMGGQADLAAALTYGPYGGYHGHLDKLSFVFYGHGQELGVDPGRAASQAYRLPIHREWYKATVGHNTVMAHGRSQRPCAGRLEQSYFDRGIAAVVVAAAPYFGITHRRLLLLTDKQLLVADRLTARRATRFDWIYHQRAAGLECRAAATPAAAPVINGGAYFDNVRVGGGTRPIKAVFHDAPIRTFFMADAGTVAVLTADGPGRAVTDRVPLIMLTQTTDDFLAAAVLEPLAGDQESVVRNIRITGRNGGGARVELDTDTGLLEVRFGEDYLLVNRTGPAD